MSDGGVMNLASKWLQRAEDLEQYAQPASIAFRTAATELEAALRAAADELLPLDAAAAESGYSPDHLRHLVARGAIPNAGAKRRPRIRRADLPKKPHAQSAPRLYDVDTDARALAGRIGAR